MKSLSKKIFAGMIVLILITIFPNPAGAVVSFGPRAGYDFDTEKMIVGAEAELPKTFQNFRFAPSIDFELGDNPITAINGDFRMYLFHLPETGLHFYGSAGPTLMLYSSSGGDSGTEIGLSLVAGMKIPMKGPSRYNFELRFGIGDIPELKMTLGILFGI